MKRNISGLGFKFSIVRLTRGLIVFIVLFFGVSFALGIVPSVAQAKDKDEKEKKEKAEQKDKSDKGLKEEDEEDESEDEDAAVEDVVPAQPEEGVETITSDQMSGTVGSVSQDAVSIIFQSNRQAGLEEEMVFEVDPANKIVADMLPKIKYGDTVTVQYEETEETVSKEQQDGTKVLENKLTKRKATGIILVRTAPPLELPPKND